MRRAPFVVAIITAVIALAAPAAFAGQVWTDGNGDGLPDQGSFTVMTSSNLTVDLWIDTQSFAFTNYQAWINPEACLPFVSAGYDLTGGTNFPIDTFTSPPRVGFAGSGYANRHGVIKIGHLVVHAEPYVNCCVYPTIDPDGTGTYCVLGAPGGYLLFTSAYRSCYHDLSATEPTSWGNLKGLYR